MTPMGSQREREVVTVMNHPKANNKSVAAVLSSSLAIQNQTPLTVATLVNYFNELLLPPTPVPALVQSAPHRFDSLIPNGLAGSDELFRRIRHWQSSAQTDINQSAGCGAAYYPAAGRDCAGAIPSVLLATVSVSHAKPGLAVCDAPD